MKRYLFLLLPLLWKCNTVKPTSSQQTDITYTDEKAIEFANSITSEELKDMLFHFASDEFQGRDTGTEGEKLAINYLKSEYKNNDIPAAKKDGDYVQNVPLKRSVVPEGSIVVNGKTFHIQDDFVTYNAFTSVNENNIVYVSYGIEDQNYSDYKNLDVKGKIVIAKGGEPQNNDGTYVLTGTDKKSKWSNYRESIAEKFKIAEEKGAKAILYYDPSIYKSAINRYQYLKRNASSRLEINEASNSFVSVYINDKIARELIPYINSDDSSKNIKAKTNFEITNEEGEFMSYNVAAFIKGNEKPNEYIVISAHLDHIGVDNEGNVFNGADDDGSGNMAVLEIAEAFKLAEKAGYKPKRSIVFLHVTAEEKGLLGSRYYTDFDPIFPLGQTVCNLNIDMIGRTDPKRKSENVNYIYLIGADKLSTTLHTVSEEANQKFTKLELDYTYNSDSDPNRFYYRSDHYNFAKNNIPVIFYFNGTHKDYHKITDTPDKINYELLAKRAQLIFHTAWEVANREERIEVDKK